ncbi:hypothetical protein Patl1_20798 [Pistacia atlantica]|uniref:Uncharacterized protein n=1 Tax=Pistacia atlantica TaxID=434234 RepID=A0ACC1BLH8_9ROSI|nr:hypothetical protein Patl1_20798 [Pistacia atlantica]
MGKSSLLFEKPYASIDILFTKKQHRDNKFSLLVRFRITIPNSS